MKLSKKEKKKKKKVLRKKKKKDTCIKMKRDIVTDKEIQYTGQIKDIEYWQKNTKWIILITTMNCGFTK